MEAPLRFNETSMLTDGREKRRKPDMWTPEERAQFIDVFLAQGRDFKAVLERVKSKNKEQVRQFYYRSLEKVNKLLRPFQYAIRDKSCADAILALKCYWTLERRCDRSPKNIAGFADELYRMILEAKGAAFNSIVGSAFAMTGYPMPSHLQAPPTLTSPHRPTPVPAYLVIRPPPLIPSLSPSHFPAPVATPSPPRHGTLTSLAEYQLTPPVLLPSLQSSVAMTASLAPPASLGSHALPPFADMPQLAPLKRHTHPEVFPQLPPLKRLKSPPSPPPSHFALPPPPAPSSSLSSTAAATARPAPVEEENTRLHTAAEVLAGLLPKPSGVSA